MICRRDRSSLTLPEGIWRVKSLKIWMSGRIGYLKLTFWKSMFPLTSSSVKPSSLLESISDFWSSKENKEIAESLAFVESEAMALVRAIPIVDTTRAKKTYTMTYCVKYQIEEMNLKGKKYYWYDVFSNLENITKSRFAMMYKLRPDIETKAKCEVQH